MTSLRGTVDAIEQLVSRIIAGEAVFLIGAGFSLDSEPNSSSRLVRRLVARFAAITELLQQVPESEARRLREGLRVTFKLGDEELTSEAMIAPKVIDQLTPVYYNINDWMCSAFTILLRELKANPSLIRKVRAREKEMLELAPEPGAARYDDVPLDNYDVDKLSELGNDSGKALFLETMGFDDDRVWRGRPDDGFDDATSSYRGLLRDRHTVIARLAREGITPLILTTNFDLLLEGACRVAGFEVGDVAKTDPAKPSAAYDRLLVVAGATDFFARGTAFRAALLLKIHGCVKRYRDERRKGTLPRYLQSMVFTYREIQNWRKDSWSRDLVSTLLRTRTIVLCGYSGADPVIHDTIRTVYEEIQMHRVQAGESLDESTSADKDSRAFFTGASGKAEFAGLEILRASSRAAGVARPKLFDHPNYLGFHFPPRARDARQAFPSIDELFLWLYHRCLRRLQYNAIRSDLQRIAVMLLHRNVAPADVEEIASLFDAQCKAELKVAAQWEDSDASRRQFQEMTSWTNQFHVALLRECALIETLGRSQRSGLRIQDFREPSYYFSLLDRPGWGAWGAVLELALRRMSARPVAVVRSPYPVVTLAPRATDFTRTAVVLRGPAHPRHVRGELQGLYRYVQDWRLMSWLRPDPGAGGTPTAEDIWRWALRPQGDETRPPGTWFGESNEEGGDHAGVDAGAADEPVRPAGRAGR